MPEPQVWTAIGHARRQLELERRLAAVSEQAWSAADRASDNARSEHADNASNRASDADWYANAARNALDMLDMAKAQRATEAAEAHARAAEAHAEESGFIEAVTVALEAEQLV